MKSQTAFSKKDLVVALVSVLFVMMNIGAINGTGRRRAKEMVCLSNLCQWSTMFEMFTNDNDGYFNKGLDGTESELWMDALQPYYKDNWNLLLCPEAKNITGSVAFRAWWRDLGFPVGGQHRYVGSYGINSWTNNTGGIDWHWKNVQNIPNKIDVPLLLDSIKYGALPRDTDSPPQSEGGVWVGDDETKRFCINRHNGGVNGLFMDWSARKVGLKELWTLKWHRNFDTEGPWTKAGGAIMWDWPEWMWNFKGY